MLEFVPLRSKRVVISFIGLADGVLDLLKVHGAHHVERAVGQGSSALAMTTRDHPSAATTGRARGDARDDG
jgi:hypothetical protein